MTNSKHQLYSIVVTILNDCLWSCKGQAQFSMSSLLTGFESIMSQISLFHSCTTQSLNCQYKYLSIYCNALSPPTFGSYGWVEASKAFFQWKTAAWTVPKDLATWTPGDHDDRNAWWNPAVVDTLAVQQSINFFGLAYYQNEFRSSRQRSWWMELSGVVACIYLFPKDVVLLNKHCVENLL